MTKLESIINKAVSEAAHKAVAEVLSLPLDDLVGIVGDPVKPGVAAYKPPKPSIFRLKKPVAKAEPKAKAERKPMSAARKAGLKLQGRYIGTLRNASESVKAQAKKIKARDGFQAALAFLAKAKSGKLPKPPAAKAQTKPPQKKVALQKNPVKAKKPVVKKG